MGRRAGGWEPCRPPHPKHVHAQSAPARHRRYPQHVVQRGKDRQSCFFNEDDYGRYLQELRESWLEEGWQVHAYVLMTNHVHLLLTPQEPDRVARVMQTLGRRYVRYVNDRYRRTGTLWESRYKASLVGVECAPLRSRLP